MQTKMPRQENPFNIIMHNIEAVICLVGMAGMLLIVTIQVICRFILNNPIGWAEEVARMFTILVTFGGSSYAFHVGAHVGVSILVDRLPSAAKKTARIFGQLLIITFFLFMLHFGTQLALSQIGRTSIAAKIPMVIPYSFLPIGAFMVLIRIVQETIKIIKTPAQSEGRQ